MYKMRKLLLLLPVSSARTGNIIAITIILFFGILAIIRLYPFENSLNEILNGPTDDWNLYAKTALKIKHEGILLPSIQGDYWAPNAFLYSYFLALCFLLFGDNTIPIFIIQNLLLGFSVVLIYWTFRNKMRPLTAIILLITLSLFGLLDVSMHYTFRFLGENLALFIITVFFFCFIKGMEQNRIMLQIIAAFFLGTSILIRPNIFPSAIAIMILVIGYFVKQGKQSFLNLFLFIFWGIAGASFLAIRNHIISETWTLFPGESISAGKFFLSNPDISFYPILKKLLSCFGFLSIIEPQYQWRPHWTIMWIGYLVYLFLRVKSKRKFEIWEITTHLFIFSYYGLLIFIINEHHLLSYGFRYFIPATFIVLPFLFIALEELMYLYKKRQDKSL